MHSQQHLDRFDASRVIDVVMRELDVRDVGAAVAVVDAHGELVAFMRTDGCPLASINNAIHKAFTAAREGVPSSEIGRRSKDEGFPITNFGDLRYTGWGGGVPIDIEGTVVGAVGVSGLAESDDITIAELGARAVSG